MIVTDKDKEIIATRTKQRKQQFAMSLEQVADQVEVNKATVNKLVHKDEHWKTQSLSQEMWMKFAEWVGYSLSEDSWQVDRNATNFRRYYNMCNHVKEDSILRIISDRFGKGKSTALKAYRFDHETHAYYFKCHRSWTQKVFVGQIKKALKLSGGVQNVFQALEDITAHIQSIKHMRPILMFDEYNRLPEGSKAQVFSLYEMLENTAGFVLCGGENLQKELTRGVGSAKQDCQEVFDRGGSKYLSSKELKVAEIKADIKGICEMNGVADPMQIAAITNNFTGSFRKVKADIDDYKKKQRKGAKNG